ncbi:MAG: hypothetical protein ASARMPRED_008223 [Alectoria sarmentosa]|nr:MAG: hypothetical protein ASARMPRED_008223 [Alectoria sarmentosa]
MHVILATLQRSNALAIKLGKVPGARAKKKKPPNAPNTTATTTTSTTTSAEVNGPRESFAPTTLSRNPSVHNAFDDDSVDWMTDLQNSYETDLVSFDGVAFDDGTNNFDDGHDEGRICSTSRHDSSVITPAENAFSLGDDLMVPDVDFSIEEVTRQRFISNSNANNDGNLVNESDVLARAEPSVEHTSSQEQQSRRDVDSRCVLACTDIISNLESYVLAELKALDLCLAIVRQTVDQLRRLVDTQQASRNFRCMALFSVIMYQIIELLEVGCAAFLVEGESRPANVVPDGLHNNSTPGFGFGAFRMGAKEQRAWRTDIVLKELRQSSEVLQKIITLARLGPRHPSPGTSEERAACYSGLERRFAALRESLGKYV